MLMFLMFSAGYSFEINIESFKTEFKEDADFEHLVVFYQMIC